MQLDNLYQEVILDHYKNPQNKKLADNNDAQVHHVNPSCGDEITLGVKLDGSTISSINWEGVGCSISQASTSIMSDLLMGKSLEDAETISESFLHLMQSKGTEEGNPDLLEDAVALAGVSQYPARIKCALLGWMAFKDASVQALANEKN
jgi:nitrogen fixation protein NifU and related proteins